MNLVSGLLKNIKQVCSPLFLVNCASTFHRDHEIRKYGENKAVEVEERVEEVLCQGQKDLQEARTKHKKELTKVKLSLQIYVDYFHGNNRI